MENFQIIITALVVASSGALAVGIALNAILLNRLRREKKQDAEAQKRFDDICRNIGIDPYEYFAK